MSTWPSRMLEQIRGINPFEGDCKPSKVPLLGWGRLSLPFPHPWNYKDPIAIFEAFFWNADRETGSGKYDRYLYLAGFPPVLMTREPAVIKAILLATGDQPGQFDRDPSPTAGIARATGEDSLLYANGEVWRRQKRMAAKPFSRGTLFQPEEFHQFERTFRQTIAERLEALRARQQESGQKTVRVRLEPELQAVMLEMLVNNFFGASVPYAELRDRYVPALTALIDHMIADTVAPGVPALAAALTGKGSLLTQRKADFETLTDLALAGRGKGLGLWGQFQSDALDEALRANLHVFLAGALEATTSFAAWTLSHLSRRPDLQERIHDEVKDMDVYDPENLARAKTLHRVLEETLRLTPALYFFPRRAAVDIRIETSDGRKMLIPEGTHIRLDIWHANRCEAFWGEAVSGHPAGVFAPERWEVLAQKGMSSQDVLHFGFGNEPRACPGKFLGQLEVGLVVGGLVKVFRFKAAAEKTGVRAGVTTKPDDGVLVDLELR